MAKIKQKRRPRTTTNITPPPPAIMPELADIVIGGVPKQLDVNFCCNHTCDNFGAGAASEAGKRAYKFTRPRDDWSWHLTCRICGQLQRMFNNVATESVFLHVLKNHMLYEYCEKYICLKDCNNKKCKKDQCELKRCENHRLNLYTHFGSKYVIKTNSERQNIFQARCKGDRCGAGLTVGKALGLYTNQEHVSRYMDDYGLFLRLVCNDNGPKSVMDILQCSATNYAASLRNLAAVSRQVSNYYFMRLLSPEMDLQDAHMHLYTDIIEIPVHTGGKSQRAATLGYIVTVTDYRQSYCVLAATPLFFPDEKHTHKLRTGLLTKCQHELNLAECFRQHAHLYLPGDPISLSKNTDTGETGETAYPPMGLDGFLMRDSYALLGHFLFLRKLTHRVGTVIHHFDGERTLRAPAMIAFSDRIKDKRCELVIASYLKTTKGKKLPDRNTARFTLQSKYRGQQGVLVNKDASLRRVDLLKNGIPDIREKIENAGQEYYKKQQTESEDKEKKRLERYRKKGEKAPPKPNHPILPFRVTQEDFWVSDPVPPSYEPGRRYLWLTRRLECSIEYELDLYLKATIQPIDSFFGALRATTSTTKRATSLPSQGNKKGYGSHAWLPANIVDEVTLRIFYWNFCVRRGSGKQPRASILKFYDGEESMDINDVFTSFRSGVFDRAREISSWAGI